jgi:PAS domain S-box-containing protein
VQETRIPDLDAEASIRALKAEVAELRAQLSEREEDPAHVRLRALLAHCPDVIYIKDSAGRFIEVSDNMLEALGLPRDAVIGHTEAELFSPAMAERFAIEDEQVRAEGRPILFEKRFDVGGHVFITRKYLLPNGEIAGIATDISARVEAEQAAHRTSARLRAAVEGTKIAPFELNLSTKQGMWSPAMFRLIGHEPTKDLIGTVELWRSVIHPDDLDLLESEYAESLKNHTPWQLQTRIVTPSGEVRWLLSYGHFSERDGDIYSNGIALDVTEQRKMEATIHDSAARLQLAMDAGQMAVWEHLTGHDTIAGSPELNRMFGLPAETPLTVGAVAERMTPGHWERIAGTAVQALGRGERFFEAEFHFERPDGNWRWFLMRAEMELDHHGQALRTFGVLLDITSRKAAEAALAEREHELSSALKAGALAVLDVDYKTWQFRPSPELNRLYGYSPDHALTIEDIRSRYHPAQLEQVRELALRDDADPHITSFRRPIRLLLPGDVERWIEGVGEYLRDDDGHILRSRGVLMDITDRVLMERHQRLLMAELNHRVKNTLAIVQGIAHQTFRGQGDADATRFTFEGRLQALSRAHDLLTRENWEAADLRDIIDDALHAHGGLSGRYTIDGPALRLQPKPAVTIAMALHELATNATKYGALSAPEGRVAVSWRVVDEGDPRLCIEWRECDGPPVAPPRHRGFGSRMIERALATELRGKAHMAFEPSGLVCTIEAPLPPLTPLM